MEPDTEYVDLAPQEDIVEPRLYANLVIPSRYHLTVSFDSSSYKRSSPKYWTDREDKELRRLVSTFGMKDWTNIASYLPGRSGKQCCERWKFHLNPTIKRAPLSATEIRTLTALQAELGNQWSTIAKRMPGRTSSRLKNTWYRIRRNNQIKKWTKPAPTAKVTCQLKREGVEDGARSGQCGRGGNVFDRCVADTEGITLLLLAASEV